MTDQSASLNAKLADAAYAKGGGVALKAGTYLVDYTVQVPDGVTFDLSAGAELRQPDDGTKLVFTSPPYKNRDNALRSRAVIDVHGHLVGGTMIGTNLNSAYVATLEAQHGIRVHDGGTIDGTQVRTVWGDGVYADGANVRVSAVDVDGTGRQGCGCSNVTDLLIENSTFIRCGRTAFDIEPQQIANEACRGVHIRNCHFGSLGLGYAGHTGGSVIGSGGDGYVERVLVEDCTSIGPFFVDCGTVAQRRGVHAFHRCSGGAPWNDKTFTFHHIDGVTVDACHQAYASAKAGLVIHPIEFDTCTAMSVTGCEFPGATLA